MKTSTMHTEFISLYLILHKNGCLVDMQMMRATHLPLEHRIPSIQSRLQGHPSCPSSPAPSRALVCSRITCRRFWHHSHSFPCKTSTQLLLVSHWGSPSSAPGKFKPTQSGPELYTTANALSHMLERQSILHVDV